MTPLHKLRRLKDLLAYTRHKLHSLPTEARRIFLIAIHLSAVVCATVVLISFFLLVARHTWYPDPDTTLSSVTLLITVLFYGTLSLVLSWFATPPPHRRG